MQNHFPSTLFLVRCARARVCVYVKHVNTLFFLSLGVRPFTKQNVKQQNVTQSLCH